MIFRSDVDIDLANREDVLAVLDTTPASILRDNKLVRHNTGIYVTDIPRDPFTGMSAIEYNSAEDRGYVKLDFLNVNLYKQVRDEAHLIELMKEPDWAKLYDPEFCSQLIHIGAHYDTLIKMPEAVTTIARMAMFLAIIRPGKKHLVGLPWAEVAKTIWEKPDDGGYAFKKAHGIAYSTLVTVNMNLIEEQISTNSM